MSINIIDLVAIISGLWLYVIIWVASSAITGRVFGQVIRQVTLGIGPSIATFQLARVECILKCIPWSGNVQFFSPIHEQSQRSRIGIFLIPMCLTLLIGGILFYSNSIRFIQLAALPGLVYGVLNLLPIPPYSGGFLAIELLPRLRDKDPNTYLPQWVLLFSIVLAFCIQVLSLWILVFHTDSIVSLLNSNWL